MKSTTWKYTAQPVLLPANTTRMVRWTPPPWLVLTWTLRAQALGITLDTYIEQYLGRYGTRRKLF